jgi:hypothetical protein
MTRTANNRTVFTTSTSIQKGDDRNHINGPPTNPSGTLNGQLKYWKGQKILPDDAMTIAALDLELKSLNYKIRKVSTCPFESRATNYFRSSVEKRMIGALVIRNTIRKKETQQSEIRDTLGLSKGLVSKVCLECVEESWFYVIEKASPIFQYQASKMMVQSAKRFSRAVFEDVLDPVILEYLRRFSIRQLQNNLDRVHTVNSETQ